MDIGGPGLLDRLIKIAGLYQDYQDQAERLNRQHSWLIDLQRLLKPREELTGQEVQTKVNHYFVKLDQDKELDETDRTIAQHIITTFRNRWWGLFVCYDVPGLPATNNDLESFFGHLKTNQRRITGRKSVIDVQIMFLTFKAVSPLINMAMDSKSFSEKL